QVYLRAPSARLGQQFAATALAVDGTLHGQLSSPDGNLHLSAEVLDAGQIALHAPRIEATLRWPWARLRIDSAVAQGRVLLAGDARIDDDRDGLRLANFTVAWPGNELRLAHDAHTHAHLHGGQLRAEGFVRVQGGGPELTFDADAPIQGIPQLAAAAPVRADVRLRDADLGQLADRLHIEVLRRQQLKGSL